MNYIGKVETPRVTSTHIAKVTVPTGGLYAGQVVYCESMDNALTNNFEVYVATQPTTANLGSTNLAIVLNGSNFETLADGRRPDGQPDFTQYVYPAGSTATVAFIDEHLRYSVGYDSIDPNTVTNIAIGKYLIPANASNNLVVSDTLPSNIGCALKVVGMRSMPLGGQFGIEYATTYICIAEKDVLDAGNYILSFSLPNQVGTSVINQTAGTIACTVAGSRTNIAASFVLSTDATATVGGVAQVSDTTTNTFTSPVTYVVTSETGETKNYVVTVSLATYSLDVTEDAYVDISVTRNGQPVGVGPDAVTYGDILTIDTTLTTGHQLESLTLNGTAFATGGTHTVTGAVEIVATSSITDYLLAVTDTNATTTILRDGSAITAADLIYYGDVLTISAIPAEPATSVAITVNGSAFTSGETHTVVGDVTVVSTGS